MNKDKLTSLCHKTSKETGLSFNSVMVYYFLESVLKQIAKSTYKENLIFKGGFLLSNVVGIQSRSTVDIDLLLRDTELTNKKIEEMLIEIIDNDEIGDIQYKIIGIVPIKEKDLYQGSRVSILCQLENIRQIIPLDIATGDVITPDVIEYEYISDLDNAIIPIKAYPLETMLAEKLQTIYARGFLNSRSKDFYDLYIVHELKRRSIDYSIFKKACINTFAFRNTEFNEPKIISLLIQLQEDKVFLKRWDSYVKKNLYAQHVTFEEVIQSVLILVSMMSR